MFFAWHRVETVSPSRAIAFTLTELLVVISIVSLLMALLLPTLYKARRLAQNTQCHVSHKQMWLSYHMYMFDYKDRFYPAEFARGNSDLTSFGNNQKATWQGTRLQRELIKHGYASGTLEYSGTADGSAVTLYKGAGRCPTASDDYIYKTHAFPLAYNSSLGMGYPAFIPGPSTKNPDPYKGAMPYLELMPGAYDGAGMPHPIRNYLNGMLAAGNYTKRPGLYREADLYKTKRVGLFYDGYCGNREPNGGSYIWRDAPHRPYASGSLHDDTDKLNIIFIDGHAASLTQTEWFDDNFIEYF